MAIPERDLEVTTTDPVELKSVYLDRLEHILRLRHKYAYKLNTKSLNILNKAIYATLCNCIDIGAHNSAHDILKESASTTAPRENITPKNLGEDYYTMLKHIVNLSNIRSADWTPEMQSLVRSVIEATFRECQQNGSKVKAIEYLQELAPEFLSVK